ncbi:hypothetical protein ACHAPW_006669 [Verticillium nonalfalfae]
MKSLNHFPLPLNIGTDICQVSRIFRLLTGPRGTRFLHRVLTPEERAAASATQLRPLPAPAGSLDGGFEVLRANHPEWWKRSTFVAGRFAAKEAAFKAHPFWRLGFGDVVVSKPEGWEGHGSGPPVAVVGGAGGGQSALLSISHDGDYATAAVASLKGIDVGTKF